MPLTVKFNQISSDPKAYELVLIDGQSQPIGHATGEFRQYTEWYNGQPYFFLTNLAVNNATYRQHGLGSQLLRVVEAFARKEGAHWIRGQMGNKTSEYTPTPTNEGSLRTFWTTNGYGLKQEIYDHSIRFWKPLHRSSTD